jgi:FkbM family methyltransferase
VRGVLGKFMEVSLSLKDAVRDSIGQGDLYQRAKASWVYDLYWWFFDRKIIEDRRSETKFYQALLQGFREGDVIFDIGANQGYKADIFLRMGARVVAVEPDDASQQVLRQKFLKYRLSKKPLSIIGKAVSDRESVQRMWIDTPGSAKNTLSQKWADTLRRDDHKFGQKLDFGQWKDVETTSIDDLISKHGAPFFVKIDIEGHEINALKGLRQPVPYLSFEVNLPEFLNEGLECVRILGNLSADGAFNYSPDCRHGLLLERWLGSEDFSRVLSNCSDESIEIFWKAHNAQQ